VSHHTVTAKQFATTKQFSVRFDWGVRTDNRERHSLPMSMPDFQFPISNVQKSRGYTLIELIVAVGLFAMVMLLASGAYLLMIGINRQTQGIASGVDNLSYAIETMARTIRTGSAYTCGGLGDCPNGASQFSFTNANRETVVYDLSSAAIQETIGGGTPNILTDPAVTVSSLMFYVIGTTKNDGQQPHVTIVITGDVVYAAGKTEHFSIETGATMRGSDI
jgi:prepilin-type N-terminal cleavage/methylation domain-containing protein